MLFTGHQNCCDKSMNVRKATCFGDEVGQLLQNKVQSYIKITNVKQAGCFENRISFLGLLYFNFLPFIYNKISAYLVK